MDQNIDELLAELANRRGEETRTGKAFPATLGEEAVQVVNLSFTGARLVVQGTQVDGPAPLEISLDDGRSISLLCEPKWHEQLGESVSVIGVAFPQGQPEVQDLRAILEAQ